MMTIQGNGGDKLVFNGERKVIPNCMILVMTSEKIIIIIKNKGYLFSKLIRNKWKRVE